MKFAKNSNPTMIKFKGRGPQPHNSQPTFAIRPSQHFTYLIQKNYLELGKTSTSMENRVDLP